MNTSTTRLRPAPTVRHDRKTLRIRILSFFAIDRMARAANTLSPHEAAVRREQLIRIDTAIRAQGVLHPQHVTR